MWNQIQETLRTQNTCMLPCPCLYIKIEKNKSNYFICAKLKWYTVPLCPMSHAIVVLIFALLFHTVAKSYSRCLRCLTEVSHVSCTTRSMLSCSDMVQSMYSDWQLLDADYLIKQCLSLMSGNVDRDARKLNKCRN